MLGPFFFIVTQLLLGFLSKNLKLSQVIALRMRTGEHIQNSDATPEGWAGDVWP